MDPLLTEMKGLAEKYKVPMSAIAINWVICKGAIPLGGARNAEQAEQVGQKMRSG
jgi:aryl-alcohol dehydrogenase-like predicted oxidoreductase